MPPLEKKTPPLPDMKKRMSKLERLIEELCPNGVEYKTIDDCIKKIDNIKWKNEESLFQYIDLSSVDRETHKIIETTEINKDSAPSRAQQIVKSGDILFGTTRPLLKRYCQIDETYHNQICSTGFCVLRPDLSIINARWLYHIVSSFTFMDYVEKHQQGASYPSISDSDIKKYKIPVPPLPVQKEIVMILDIFSELISELNLELNKRKSQYKYYINKLLTFSQPIPFEHLKEHIILRDNERKPVTKKDRISGCYPYYGANGIQDYVGNFIFDGTFLLVGEDGSVITENGAPILNWAVGKIWVNNHAHILSEKKGTLLRYLYYALQCVNISSVVRGTPPKLNQQNLNNIKIPVPPLEEQKRIVSILDRFDTLCNDLSSGLPAEIEARKKQYEYYRDKLLTFKEAK